MSTQSQSTNSSSARRKLGLSGGMDSAFAGRVELYLKVTFLMNLFLWVGAAGLRLSGIDSNQYERQEEILVQMGVWTLINGGIWIYVRQTLPRFYVAVLIQAVVTLLLNGNYIWITVGLVDVPRPESPVYAILAVTIVLVLRSSLVPSPAVGTAVVGSLSMLGLVGLTLQSNVENSLVASIWLAMFGVVVVVVTTLTSNIIYGLQISVQAATKLGQYELQNRIGSGGMGEVYLAKHALLNRPTAIKLLKDATEATARGRFQQEVQIASGLTHPNTVEIYDYGRTPDGVFYFAMEFVEGATLEQIVARTGPMPATRIVHLLMQAAGSLSEAHRRGLVHRDIKPSNLMVCERGGEFDTLKVLDFGLVHDLAKAADQEESTRERSTLTGTPFYLAPEVIVDEAGFSPESDVYALGATAYFLATGEPPFSNGDLAEILSDHLVTIPEPPSSGSRALDDLMMQCLRKDPATRPRDANALRDLLLACANDETWSSDDARVWWTEHREIMTSTQENGVNLVRAS